MYYLRTRAAADAIKFTVDQQVRVCYPSNLKIWASSAASWLVWAQGPLVLEGYILPAPCSQHVLTVTRGPVMPVHTYRVD